jgi:hypothetical protein
MFRNCFIFHGSSGDGRGYVCTVIKSTLKVVGKGVGENGRFIWCDVEVGDSIWRVLNVYAHNDPGGRTRLWKDITLVLEGRMGLMGGDFNMVTREEDRIPSRSIKLGGEERRAWDMLMASGVFLDLGEEGREITWSNRQEGANSIFKRLDRMFLVNGPAGGGGFKFRVCNHKVFSDHFPIWGEIGNSLLDGSRGGRFRVDPKWLELESVQQSIRTMWNLDKGIAKNNIYRKWSDKIKRIKKVIQELSIFRSRRESVGRNSRLREIKELRELLVVDPLDEASSRKLRVLIEEEEKFQVVEALRARRFSRFHWVKKGDLPTKFYFNFLKNIQPSPRIRILEERSSGEEIVDEEGIRNEFTSFFEHLYKSEDDGRSAVGFLEGVLVNKLSAEERMKLDGEVELQEIEVVVHRLAKGKSPGMDGIPNEFFQRSWEIIQEDLGDLVRHILGGGGLTEELNQSLIVLIPKLKHCKTVKDFRPISLLGGVYKIVAKILANRLRSLVPKLVHPSQAGFVPGRSLAESCLSVWAGLEAGPKQGDYVFLKIDFEKAYDRVEWRFLEDCLKVMNFGSLFRKWVGGLFKDAKAAIQVNGRISEGFPITRSVRQGCPLAPLLFALVTEPLIRGMMKAQAEGAVSGVTIGKSQLLTKMFADDAVLFLQAQEAKVKRAWEVLRQYCRGSGQLINTRKTKALWLSYKEQPNWTLQWGWEWIPPHVVFGYLGCPTGFGIAQSDRDEWVVERVRTKVGKWQNRSLAMAGRVIVINHIIGGMMNFYLGVWALSKAAIGRINSILGDFVWGKEGGRGIRVGWSWCALPRECGGLGIPNISAKGKALAAKWTFKALESGEPWAEWYKKYLYEAGFKDFKGCVGIDLASKIFGNWEMIVKGPLWIKRLWDAWVSIRPSLDLKAYWDKGGTIHWEGCLWAFPSINPNHSWDNEEKRVIRRMGKKGLIKWGQLLGGEDDSIKRWEDLKEEFRLDRIMKTWVEERLEKLSGLGQNGMRIDHTWWRKVRWKDGSPGVSPKTKFLYSELVKREQGLQKIDRRWNFVGVQVNWGRLCRKLWKSKLEAKVKIFFWKLLHHGLPIGGRVEAFSHEVNCRRCGSKETLEHVSWTGCIAHNIWGGSMNGERAMKFASKSKDMEIIPILAWCCWKIRNLVVFDGLAGSDDDIKLLIRRFARNVIQYQIEAIRVTAGNHLNLLLQGRFRDFLV